MTPDKKAELAKKLYHRAYLARHHRMRPGDWPSAQALFREQRRLDAEMHYRGDIWVRYQKESILALCRGGA